jgi:predicted alpha/beta-fold hydrolase
LALVGFSLGGNLVLKLLGEAAAEPLPPVDRGIAVCPPVDLDLCCRALAHGLARWYDRHFVSLLLRQVARRTRQCGNGHGSPFQRRPRTLYEFDERYTAPVSGFASAAHYYRESSAAAYIERIVVPTRVLIAADDPVVPRESYESAAWPAAVQRIETRHGGHLGFIGRRGVDPDRCWMDWRVVEWVGEA